MCDARQGPFGDSVRKPQIGAKTETWLENSWRRSDNIVGDLEENYAITFHGDTLWKEGDMGTAVLLVRFVVLKKSRILL